LDFEIAKCTARFVSQEGNPVYDGVVFLIPAFPYDLAVKLLRDAPAGHILLGHWIDEALFAKSCVSPLHQCSHDFPAKTLPMRAFLEPKAEFGRSRIRVFERGHAKAFQVVETPDDERKLVRFPSLRSLFASCQIFTPRWRLPWHELGNGGRDASKNVPCIRHLKLPELQSLALDDYHPVSLSTADDTSKNFGLEYAESNRAELESTMSGALGMADLFLLLVALFGLVASIFWVWMIIDCATKEPAQGNDKLVWILIIVFTHWIGALIYYLVRRPQRMAQLGSPHSGKSELSS
jgi:hypothetical protein